MFATSLKILANQQLVMNKLAIILLVMTLSKDVIDEVIEWSCDEFIELFY